MADNSDQQSLVSNTNDQPGPPKEIIPVEKTETITPIQQTENMEVHHHAHNPAVSHHKKNWKSYFWEFLMLFLAVFCGFLAENLREHYTEEVRAKQYIQSFYDDLHKNLATCSGIIDGNKKKMSP